MKQTWLPSTAHTNEVESHRDDIVESHRDDIETKPWSDLPQDLIVSVTECLYVADQTRLRAVCKDWHLQPNHGTKASDKLPWTWNINGGTQNQSVSGLSASFMNRFITTEDSLT